MVKLFTMVGNLPVRLKLAAMVVILIVPILALLLPLYNSRQAAIRDAQFELQGIAFLKALEAPLDGMPKHRGLSAAALGGDAAAKQQAVVLEGSIDADLEALGVLARGDAAGLGLAQDIKDITDHWTQLKSQGFAMQASENFEEHSAVIEHLIQVVHVTANRSGLTADQELGSADHVQAALQSLPLIIENLSQLRGLSSGVSARQIIALDEQVRLSFLRGEVQKQEARALSILSGEDTSAQRGEETLKVLVDKARSSLLVFLKMVNEQLLQEELITADPTQVFATGTAAITPLKEIIDHEYASFETVLNARMPRLKTRRNVELVLVGIALLLAIAAAIFINRLIVRQVDAINQLFSEIGMGDFDARTEVLSEDELGTAATSLNTMLDNTLTLIQSQDERDTIQDSIMKLLEEVSDVGSGDLTSQAEVSDDVTGALADSFNFMIGQLRNLVANVQNATLQVSSSANEIQTTAEHLAEGSTSQAAQIVDSSAALDEMAVSIQQVSDNAVLSASVAEQALSNARQGATAVQNTVQAMTRIRTQVQETGRRIKRLGERSQEIGDIVQLINDIADRTSILALNASIQAAHAGDAGRAFAVVAEEVERLADRASDASRQIGSLVQTIQGETNEAVTAMDDSTQEVVEGSRLAEQAGQALGEIEGVSTRLAELIQSISQASSQQARGSENLSKAMSEISDVTQQTAAGTKQAAVSISNMAELADELRRSVSTFKLPASMNGQQQ